MCLKIQISCYYFKVNCHVRMRPYLQNHLRTSYNHLKKEIFFISIVKEDIGNHEISYKLLIIILSVVIPQKQSVKVLL
jgi:hypothetical protein